MVNGEYDITIIPGFPTSVKVTDYRGHLLFNKDEATKGKFSFTTEEYLVFEVCFETVPIQYDHRNPQHTTKEVSLILKHGIETKDYQALGNASHLKPLEIELNRLEDLASSIVADLEYMKQREEGMRITNESTNSRVFYFSALCMACLMGLTISQVLYLRRYFKSKRLID
jgi:p24 family protein delta-1